MIEHESKPYTHKEWAAMRERNKATGTSSRIVPERAIATIEAQAAAGLLPRTEANEVEAQTDAEVEAWARQVPAGIHCGSMRPIVSLAREVKRRRAAAGETVTRNATPDGSFYTIRGVKIGGVHDAADILQGLRSARYRADVQERRAVTAEAERAAAAKECARLRGLLDDSGRNRDRLSDEITRIDADRRALDARTKAAEATAADRERRIQLQTVTIAQQAENFSQLASHANSQIRRLKTVEAELDRLRGSIRLRPDENLFCGWPAAADTARLEARDLDFGQILKNYRIASSYLVRVQAALAASADPS